MYPLNEDTSLYRTLHQVPKVSIIEGFHCIPVPPLSTNPFYIHYFVTMLGQKPTKSISMKDTTGYYCKNMYVHSHNTHGQHFNMGFSMLACEPICSCNDRVCGSEDKKSTKSLKSTTTKSQPLHLLIMLVRVHSHTHNNHRNSPLHNINKQ